MPGSRNSGRSKSEPRRPLLTADDELLRPERELWAEGFSCIAGVDEAGRGCLAGPVVAAAVILPRYVDLPGVYDSKQLSDRDRRDLYRDLLAQPGLFCAWGVVGSGEIDEVNILNATHRAMREAVRELANTPDVVLVDGLPVRGFTAPSRNLVGGDALSASIAAASILAKVKRDDLMIELDGKYPGYGFARNKGYGTAAHLAALKKQGPCPVHRKTFHPVWEYLADAPKQLELL